jgi:hypothetical protein
VYTSVASWALLCCKHVSFLPESSQDLVGHIIASLNCSRYQDTLTMYFFWGGGEISGQ